jgi:hypothetical protein
VRIRRHECQPWYRHPATPASAQRKTSRLRCYAAGSSSSSALMPPPSAAGRTSSTGELLPGQHDAAAVAVHLAAERIQVRRAASPTTPHTGWPGRHLPGAMRPVRRASICAASTPRRSAGCSRTRCSPWTSPPGFGFRVCQHSYVAWTPRMPQISSRLSRKMMETWSRGIPRSSRSSRLFPGVPADHSSPLQ